MAHTPGRFVWFELVTPNVADAVAFWTEVAGLSTTETAMGTTSYTRIFRGKDAIGGVAEPQMAGVPAHWTSYLSVEDVAATAKAVVANGGRVIVPATDIGIGTFALVADPQGAMFNLWRGKTGDEGAPGVHWNELWSKNAEQAVPFYRAVFGFGVDVMPMGQGPYHVLKTGDVQVGGMMTAPDPNIPPMWLPYLQVDDVDAVVERVRRNGGQVHAAPMDAEGVGRFAVVADRQGATVGVIRPAPRG